MKILNIPYETIYKCDECGCEFELDGSYGEINKRYDSSYTTPHQIYTVLYVECPLCRNEIELKKKGEANG